MKQLIKKLVPRQLIHLLKNRNENGWFGDYKSWEEALRSALGYNSDEILNKVQSATLKVKSGEAVYERDSVLFDQIHYSWPLLSALMFVAAKNNGSLHVIDFGGSLGSTYFQNKKFLDELNVVRWNVIEQQSFVEAGRLHIESEKLKFFGAVTESIDKSGLADIFVCATTLPYLKNPYFSLNEFIQYRFPYIIIDHTFFNFEERDRITVQIVPEQIYHASYPCWFLNYNKVKSEIEKAYYIISEHKNETFIFLDGRKIQYRGLFGKLKER